MSPFLRKVKTASGATAVQIVEKKHGRRTILEHLGSAHSDAELAVLVEIGIGKLNADHRLRGSLQMDLAGYGRYCGELHLMRVDRPLNHLQARVGEIAAPYAGLIDLLRPGMNVRFSREHPTPLATEPGRHPEPGRDDLAALVEDLEAEPDFHSGGVI